MEIELVETWAERAGNSIEALKIMGMGMAAIFIVILIITAVVSIMNIADKKSFEKKNGGKKVLPANAPQQIEAKATTPTNQSAVNIECATKTEAVEDKDGLSLSEESKYRKGKEEVRPESVYRKNNNN